MVSGEVESSPSFGVGQIRTLCLIHIFVGIVEYSDILRFLSLMAACGAVRMSVKESSQRGWHMEVERLGAVRSPHRTVPKLVVAMMIVLAI